MRENTTMDDAETDAIEAGAEDVSMIDEESKTLEFLTPDSDLVQVKGSLTKAGYNCRDASVLYIPNSFAQLSGVEKGSLEKLVNALMNESIVINVHTNAE